MPQRLKTRGGDVPAVQQSKREKEEGNKEMTRGRMQTEPEGAVREEDVLCAEMEGGVDDGLVYTVHRLGAEQIQQHKDGRACRNTETGCMWWCVAVTGGCAERRVAGNGCGDAGMRR
jgi:hypothetical protein